MSVGGQLRNRSTQVPIVDPIAAQCWHLVSANGAVDIAATKTPVSAASRTVIAALAYRRVALEHDLVHAYRNCPIS